MSIDPTRQVLREIQLELERRIAWWAALELALEERLHRKPRTGDDIFGSDEARADEIFALYPRSDGE